MGTKMLRHCRDVEWFEDYKVGDEFEGNVVEFTLEEIIRFARRYDPQPFHIDPVAAAESHFGGIIASGAHIMAATWGGLMHAGFLNGRAMGAPGIDDYKNYCRCDREIRSGSMRWSEKRGPLPRGQTEDTLPSIIVPRTKTETLSGRVASHK